MARTSGPGRYARRTDLDKPQPTRIATGGPYGSSKQQEQAQAAIHPVQHAPGDPGIASEAPRMPQEASNMPPADIVALLGHGGTQRPTEPLTAPMAVAPDAKTLSTQELLNQVEDLIQNSPNGVPQRILSLYYDLHDELNNDFSGVETSPYGNV